MIVGPSVLDESLFFSREEYVDARALIMPRAKAERFADEMLCNSVPAEWIGRYGYLGDDTMDLLSLVSESCWERVRQLRNETPDQARERIRAFIVRTGLNHHPQESPAG
jgi:hypothetical protein